ncbi:MAG: energy transducer TonB [Melioribacteraceae bacterium]|nr:energy transducer TonB [Melioribacteraceae bacterium]
MKKLIKILIAVVFLLAACTHVERLPNENIVEPKLKKEPKLIYPFSAQQQSLNGTTTILFTINKNGEVDATRVHKSSGYIMLDEAAEKYCKGLEFIPAYQNGEAIASSMKWEIKFNLKDFGKEIERRVEEVKSLYSDVIDLDGAEKFKAQNDILALHDDMTRNLKDGVKFNEYMSGVVQNSIIYEWEPVVKSFPLTFLLYHDFLTRYKDFDSVSVVKSKLEYALRQDVAYLNEASNISSEYKINRVSLIQKIKQFVQKNYPEFDISKLNLEVLDNNNIS